MEENIGIKKEERQKNADILKGLLADQWVLYVKTLNFHWNVVGPNFGPLHQLFQSQYEQYAGYIDEIAERIRILGIHAPGSMQEFISLATLNETKESRLPAKEMLQILLKDQEHFIQNLRVAVDNTVEENHDTGTSDFLTAIMESIEKIAWITRAHLE